MNRILHSRKWSKNDLVVLRRYDDYLKGRCFEFRALNEQWENLDSKDSHAKNLRQMEKLLEVESLEREIRLLTKNALSPEDLQNALLFYAFKLVTQDLVVPYKKLNEGIICQLESFFDLSFKDARRTLYIYIYINPLSY